MRQKWIELKPFSWWILLMRDRCVQLQLQDGGFVVREVKKHVPKGPATSRQLASVKRQTGVITGFMIIFVHSKAICARLLLCLSRSQTAGGFMTDDAGAGSLLSSVLPCSLSSSTLLLSGPFQVIHQIQKRLLHGRSSSFVSCEIFSVINSDKRWRALTEADCHVTVFHTHSLGRLNATRWGCWHGRTSSLRCISATPRGLMMAAAWPQWPSSIFRE